MIDTGTQILAQILGSVALLLWGLRMVRTGVERAFGGILRRGLERSLTNRFRAFAAGFVITIMLQSSTATMLLTSSFASRGLLDVTAGLAIVLGADVGSAAVAQILSLRLGALPHLLLLAGVMTFLWNEQSRPRNVGRILIGLGLMLLALQMIVAASTSIRQAELLASLMQSLGNEPVLAVLLGILLTWLAHSSLAMVLLLVSLTASGLLPASAALLLVIGVNMGAALPAVGATLKGAPEARRLPLANLLCRGLAGLIALVVLRALGPMQTWFGSEPARQLLNFHLGFNVALACAALPFTRQILALIDRFFMPHVPDVSAQMRPVQLDRGAFGTPALAVATATHELVRMGEQIGAMLRATMAALKAGDDHAARLVVGQDDVIDDFHDSIKSYIAALSHSQAGGIDQVRCSQVLAFATALEQSGDVLALNVAPLVRKMVKRNAVLSPVEMGSIEALFAEVEEIRRLAVAVLISDDREAAVRLRDAKARMRSNEIEATRRHMAKLQSGAARADDASAIYLDLIRDLRRISSILASIAYPILLEVEHAREEEGGQQRDGANSAKIALAKPRSLD